MFSFVVDASGILVTCRCPWCWNHVTGKRCQSTVQSLTETHRKSSRSRTL